MNQSILHVALVVRDYDEALEFFVGKLGFILVEDTHVPEQDKRWVLVRPPVWESVGSDRTRFGTMNPRIVTRAIYSAGSAKATIASPAGRPARPYPVAAMTTN